MLLAATQAAAPQKLSVEVDGVTRYYWQQDPTGTAPTYGWPVVLSFHGWRSTAASQAADDQLRVKGAGSAVIIHPEGYSDPSKCSGDCDEWQSFNGGGSAGQQAGGTDGPICNPHVVSSSSWQCYKSCAALGYCTSAGEPDICRWSHCLSDARFVEEILKTLPARDAARTYSTGHSNGAMVQYDLAINPSSAPLLAAVAPVSGIPHNGWNRGSLGTRMRYLEVQGSNDDYVQPYAGYDPIRPDKSYSKDYGWYYSAWDNTTSLWAAQRGFTGARTAFTGGAAAGFNCTGWAAKEQVRGGGIAGAAVATCFDTGGHGDTPPRWDLVWEFFGFAPPPPAPPGSHLCADIGCGAHDDTCWCTPSCASHGDCCSDYAAACGGGGGCTAAKCGGQFSCDEWIAWDPATYSCPELERDYNCDCSGCKCGKSVKAS